MSADRFAVPDEWARMADLFDTAAGLVRDYVLFDSAPWPASPASRERACERDFAKLPFSHPVEHTVLAPLQYLGSSQDHLTAMAAVLRTRQSVMALFTLLRTQVVAASSAAWLGGPALDGRERVRRAMNEYLDSLTEQMRLVGRAGPPAYNAEFDRLAQRRRAVIAGASQLDWGVTCPETPQSSKWWPKAWYIGEEPPAEMALVEYLLGEVGTTGRAGRTLYRWLSATAHVQPHALVSFVNRDSAVSRGDGSALVQLGMDGRLLLTVAVAALGSLTVALDRCVGFYGWPPDRWQQHVVPALTDIRQTLATDPQSPHDRPPAQERPTP